MESLNQEPRITKDGPSLLDFKKNCSTLEFPNKFSRHLMDMGDVYFWEKGNFHIVNDPELAKEVLKSPDYSADRGSFFISRMPNLDLSLIQNFFSVVRKMMVMSDDQEHTHRRKAAATGFDEAVLEKFKSKMNSTIQDLLDEALKSDQIEFVSQIAQRLPSTVLAELFSIPTKDREDFFKYSNQMTAFFGGASQYRNEDGVEVNQAASHLKNYFRELIVERRESPGEDYISHLVKSQPRFNLTDDELVSQAIMMLVAGQVTTTDQLCNIMYLLSAHPEIQMKLRQDLSLLPNAIEEFKRYDPAVTFLFRVARAPTRLGNQPIQPGETVFVSNHAVNRSSKIEEPFKLDIHRKNVSHFAYGHGAHYCLGSQLGRMQMNRLFEQLLQRAPFIILNQSRPSERDHYSLAFSGFKTLHLEALRS